MQYDLLVGDITISPERLKLVDFSIPVQTSDVAVFMKKVNHKDLNMFSFMEPLSISIWSAVLLALIIG